MTTVPAPLFRDPIHDGAADPTVIWNRDQREWWMVYTNRRADAPAIDDVSWVHGTDLGVASSSDGGLTWTYRGVLQGLDLEWGRHTYWAPELVDDGRQYHMYVSVIRGTPSHWAGHRRVIRHYTSPDLVTWRYESDLRLPSSNVIDACVHRLPDGAWRLWYKDEADGQHTWYADSPDLSTWRPIGPAVTGFPHEGPNVFTLGGWAWMITDTWVGQRVLRSDDFCSWSETGLILDLPGSRPDDHTYGLHGDVVTDGDQGYLFYFTHPGRTPGSAGHGDLYEHRRSSIQVARLQVEDGRLICDRDAPIHGSFLPTGGAR